MARPGLCGFEITSSNGNITEEHSPAGLPLAIQVEHGEHPVAARHGSLNNVDTTSIDNAAVALESKAYYIRRVGSDGFRIHHQPTLKKVASDRRA